MAKLFNARTFVLGGLAIAAYGALKNKQAISGLLGGGEGPSYTPEPYPGPTAAPSVANVDVAGPPANTSTAVPVPEPKPEPIDELAEEQAAAAEAANIGGPRPTYLDEEGREASEAERPLDEAGAGYAEGQEVTEDDLAANAEGADDGELAIEDAIEAQDDPSAGETVEAPPPSGDPVAAVPPPTETPAPEKSTAVWRIDEQPTVEGDAVDDEQAT